MASYTTDLCIIAAGPAGLAAAVSAAESGISVVVLEKKSVVGGVANMGMGILGIGTRQQKDQMIHLSVEECFRTFMEYTHYNVDGRVLMRYFKLSADTITWLESMGVEFEGAFRYFPKSEATWHIVKTGKEMGPGAASYMNKSMYRRAQELGVTFLLNTPAKDILKDESGCISGVTAETRDGAQVDIHCKAVLVATGGAGGNPEMILEETGYRVGENMFHFAVPGITGDGLRMAWAAGADKVPVRIEMATGVRGMDELPRSIGVILNQPNLLVNQDGKRFMDENERQNRTYMSNAVAHQKNFRAFSVVDSEIVNTYIRNGVDNVDLVHNPKDVSDFRESVEKALQKGVDYLFTADSLEELALKMGVDREGFLQTVENYNAYCVKGDEEFFKERRFMRPIKKAPFYAGVVQPSGYGTVGGIRINENCEACDAAHEPVPGLYAAGNDACNLYDDSYMFLLPGNSMGWAVNSGRIAGMEAAKYIKGLHTEE